MATIAEAQYYLPYQPSSSSDSATITITIGGGPTPPTPPPSGGGGGSSASNSYSYSYRSVVQPPPVQQAQTQAPTLPEMKPREQPVKEQPAFQEYNPELPPAQAQTTIPVKYDTVPLWFILIAAIGQAILIAIFVYLIKKTTE